MATLPRKIAGFSFQDPEAAGLPAQVPDQLIVGNSVQPGAGVLGEGFVLPNRESCHEGALDRVLHKLEMRRADPAREHGHQPAVFVPEEMLNQARCGQGPASSRISTLEPGIIRIPGHSLATSTARS